MTIPERIIQLRQAAELTRRETATRLGITPTEYRQMEETGIASGEAFPKLARLLGVSVSYLLSGEPTSTDQLLAQLRSLRDQTHQIESLLQAETKNDRGIQ